MQLLTSNLLLVGYVALAIGMAGAFQWYRGRPSNGWFAVAACSLVLLVIGAISVANSTPGGIEVIDVDEPDDDYLPPVVVDSEIEKLQLSWDSEEYADWPAATVLADISRIAYESPVDARRSLRNLGFADAETISSATMLGYVAWKDDVAVVAFRGSESEAGDWWANISRSPFPLQAGEVHSGFWTSYRAMKPQIERILAGKEIKHLWITGHSLGGALALCCGYDLVLEGRNVKGIMTFGQPMIARQSLANDIDDTLAGRYARFVNHNDFVARIPPSYRPCGRLVWFTPEGVKRSERKESTVRAFGAGPAMDGAVVDEIEPASEAEYQRWLTEQAAGPQLQYDEDGNVLLQGNSPYFADHAMSLYVTEVEAMLDP